MKNQRNLQKEQIKKEKGNNMMNQPISLKSFKAADGFWKDEMELVRKEVIPYQWEILNDRVEGAAPSFCMRNFKIAGKMNQEREAQGTSYEEPKYTFRGFESLPEDMDHMEDKFYGFVFQDSDFSKWIEAVGYSLMNHPDSELEKTADEAIDIVCAAQQENGYLDTYYIINGMDKIFTNLKDHHELYCFGHFTEGAVAYYQATGKRKILDAAIRFADFIDSYFGTDEGKCKGYPGHEIAEMALVRLYEVTGEQRYLNLAKYFVDERGKMPQYFDFEDHVEKRNQDEEYSYYQAHRPVREQDEAVGHAVRAVYLYSGMTDVAKLTEDEELWQACKTLWESTVREKMYITGGIGGTHIGESFSFPFDLPNDTAYAETCASIALMFWARRMLEKEVNSCYSDVMEQALYNTVLAGMALDGKSFYYVNPLEVLPEACHKDERKFHVKPVRQKWFGCACCPPNLARLISSVPTYAYTENEDTLFMHIHMAGEIEKTVSGKKAVFKVESGLPWNGNVKVVYSGESGVEMKLAVRIPGWCENYGVSGVNKFDTEIVDGYLYLKGIWNEGDEVSFEYQIVPKFYQADERVRENIGKVALMAGPIVYCAEEADNGAGLHLFKVDPEAEIKENVVEIEGAEFPAYTVTAKKQVEAVKSAGLYQKYQPVQFEEAEVKFIPYYAWANRGENEMMVWMRSC